MLWKHVSSEIVLIGYQKYIDSHTGEGGRG